MLIGGAGDDTIVINASNTASLLSGQIDLDAQGNQYRARVDGGSGRDTLRLAQGAGDLNLSRLNDNAEHPAIADPIAGIEIIDLANDTAANVLTLRAQDVLMLGQCNAFNTGSGWVNGVGSALGASESRKQMVVLGDALDLVQGISASDWTRVMSGASAATVNHGGNSFEVWNHNSLPAQVLVSPGVRLAAMPDQQAPSISGPNSFDKSLNSAVNVPGLTFLNTGGLAIEVLKLSITASGGRIVGITDQDASLVGTQVSGTASDLQALFGQARYIATAASSTLGLTLSDQAGNSSTFNFNVL